MINQSINQSMRYDCLRSSNERFDPAIFQLQYIFAISYTEYSTLFLFVMFINEYKPEFQEMKNFGNFYILARGVGLGLL